MALPITPAVQRQGLSLPPKTNRRDGRLGVVSTRFCDARRRPPTFACLLRTTPTLRFPKSFHQPIEQFPGPEPLGEFRRGLLEKRRLLGQQVAQRDPCFLMPAELSVRGSQHEIRVEVRGHVYAPCGIERGLILTLAVGLIEEAEAVPSRAVRVELQRLLRE